MRKEEKSKIITAVCARENTLALIATEGASAVAQTGKLREPMQGWRHHTSKGGVVSGFNANQK